MRIGSEIYLTRGGAQLYRIHSTKLHLDANIGPVITNPDPVTSINGYQLQDVGGLIDNLQEALDRLDIDRIELVPDMSDAKYT